MTAPQIRPQYNTDTFPIENLVMSPDLVSKSLTLARNQAITANIVRGTLLVYNPVSGLYSFLDSAETVIAAETIYTGTASPITELDFALAHPPIPGTLSITTDDTIPSLIGFDNTEGSAASALGSYTVDYNTGRGRAKFATGPAENKLVIASYKHRAVVAGFLGLPVGVLGEEAPVAALNAADYVTFGYVEGIFRAESLVGYSAGYANHMRRIGLLTK